MRYFLWMITAGTLTLAGLFYFRPSVMAGPIPPTQKGNTLMDHKLQGFPVAIFAGGCFWCTESEYRSLNGVLFTRVGYIGGHMDNPKYEDTHDSKSGHAEAVEVTFDPAKISYKALVEFFLTQAHDPTQLNRQGPDVGTQYRSAIFFTDETQKATAQEVINTLTTQKRFEKPIVTTLEPATQFWEAEEYHQQFYEKYEARTGQPHMNDWLKRQRRQSTSTSN